MSLVQEESSFRDRDGAIFYQDGKVLRVINQSYQANYEMLLQSGLYKELVDKKYLVAHTEVESISSTGTYKTLQVEKIPFISYPYEWDFYALRSAALLTLRTQRLAMEKGMSLKDATAFNVQFKGNKPVFIDTLSFEKFEEGKPWVAYKQFCQHFLSPLLLWYYGYDDLHKLSINHLDGIPLPLTSKLLPAKSRLSLLVSTHIHVHARFEKKYEEQTNVKASAMNISKSKVLAIIDHLEDGIKNLELPTAYTNWINYYQTCSYNEVGLAEKENAIKQWLEASKPETLADIGCNTGHFSELASKFAKHVYSFDFDCRVISKLFVDARKKGWENITPLIADITNPTPAIGWNNTERKALAERLSEVDTTMALALIHHLAIGNNVPLPMIANAFSKLGKKLIIEFVPKTDVQVAKLLVTKKDIFQDYTLENFETSFSKYYDKVDARDIPGSDRKLYYWKLK